MAWKNYNTSGSRKKSKFTSAQKKAFYRGQGYRASHEGKRIPYERPDIKQAFKDGYLSITKYVMKYPEKKNTKSDE